MVEKTGFPISFSRPSGPAPAFGRKRRLTLFIAGLFSGVAAASSAATLPNAIDPVFGLTYNPAHIKFAAPPAGFLKRCPELANSHWSRDLFIYGKESESGTTYYVVGGYYVSATPGTGTIINDPKGAVVALTSKNCTLLGPAREVFQFPDGLLAPSAGQALAKNVVMAFDTAFGTRAAFRAALQRQNAAPGGPHDALLQNALASQ